MIATPQSFPDAVVDAQMLAIKDCAARLAERPFSDFSLWLASERLRGSTVPTVFATVEARCATELLTLVATLPAARREAGATLLLQHISDLIREALKEPPHG